MSTLTLPRTSTHPHVARAAAATGLTFREVARDELSDYAAAIGLFGLAARFGTPLLVLDPRRLGDRIADLRGQLPGVELHFATKTLPHPEALARIAAFGASFEVASRGEIAQLAAIGVDIASCLHTHPIRTVPDIADAYRRGIRRFVIDNPLELAKLTGLPDDADVLVRLSYPNPQATSDLSAKFGATAAQAVALVDQAGATGRRVAGFSFHVGSQATAPGVFDTAITRTTALMTALESEGRPRFDVLDIGGGFPVAYSEPVPSIQSIGAEVRRALARGGRRDRLLAEPGRFLAASAMTLVTRVVGSGIRADGVWHYLDDGLYGSYSNILTEGTHPLVFAASELSGREAGAREPATIAGPTCDSIDVIARGIDLPRLRVGDLLVSPMMGAYTSATASPFNGIPPTRIHVLDEVGMA